MILTTAEIKELARFAGLALADETLADHEHDETEIAVEDHDYEHIAYFYDYPDEGYVVLGRAVHRLPKPLTGGSSGE